MVLAAVESAGLQAGSATADVGFGGGVGLGLLLSLVGDAGSVHGVEVSPTMLAQARHRFRRQIKNGSLQLHEAPMTALPLPDGALDAVVSTNAIYFVSDLGSALLECARVLRAGGHLALGIGDPDAMAKLPFTQHGFMLRPISEIVRSLGEAGFSRVEDRRVEGRAMSHVIVCEKT
jgi:arsenite methyltransferase